MNTTTVGNGVFTRNKISAGARIFKFEGNILKSSKLPTPFNKYSNHYVQIGADLYMGPSGNLDDYFNHSCNPNSYLKIDNNLAFLHALEDIEKNSEITWDYSTTMFNDDWTMECFCMKKECRKLIKEFMTLPKSVKYKYLKLGIIPDYICKS